MKKMKNQNMKNLCHLIYHVKTKTDVTFSSNLILMFICTITWRGFLKSNKEKQKHSPNFFFFFFFYLSFEQKERYKNFQHQNYKRNSEIFILKKGTYDDIYLINFFFLSGFSFTNIHESQDCRGRGGHFFNSSLPLPPALQTLRY